MPLGEQTLMPMWRRMLCFVLGVAFIPIGIWLLATTPIDRRVALSSAGFIIAGAWAIYHAFTSANLAR
jgi:hypothetical protein